MSKFLFSFFLRSDAVGGLNDIFVRFLLVRKERHQEVRQIPQSTLVTLKLRDASIIVTYHTNRWKRQIGITHDRQDVFQELSVLRSFHFGVFDFDEPDVSMHRCPYVFELFPCGLEPFAPSTLVPMQQQDRDVIDIHSFSLESRKKWCP